VRARHPLLSLASDVWYLVLSTLGAGLLLWCLANIIWDSAFPPLGTSWFGVLVLCACRFGLGLAAVSTFVLRSFPPCCSLGVWLSAPLSLQFGS
jgi:hypothetical protein